MLTTGPLSLGLLHRLMNRLFPLDIRLPSRLSLWRFTPLCVSLSPLLWLLPCPLTLRLLHIHQKAAVVGAAGVFEVEILSMLQYLATVTTVLNRFSMCRNVPSRTCTGNHLLLVLMILLPKCISRRELHWMLLCPISLCASAGIIKMPKVTTIRS